MALTKNDITAVSALFVILDAETTGTKPDDRHCRIAFKPENGQAAKSDRLDSDLHRGDQLGDRRTLARST
jgi:hypothetical protein